MSGRDQSSSASKGSAARRSWWTIWARFLYFGLGVKRWLLVGAIGIAISSIGLAFVIKNLFDLALPDFLPWYLEGVLLGAGGLAVILVAIYGLYRSVGPLVFASNGLDSLTDTIYTRRSRGRGPRVVAVGGGTGLSILLRGLKAYTDNLSAIVTVADDGGSSGRLRRELGMLPPGDFRSCLVAMSDDESLVRELFQYRFDQGDGLEGHSFGNLFIAAMTNITGSFDQAISESSRVLAVHGQILPATVANLSLTAYMTDGTVVHGESSITKHGGTIDRILIEPQNARAHPPAVEALEDAQLIVIGPGSLYTSILPNLLVLGIVTAMERSKATKVYVCNVATQKGETDAYTVADHVEALQGHTSSSIVDYGVFNDKSIELGPPFLGQPVVHDGREIKHAALIRGDLVDPSHPVRHDSAMLARAIMDLHYGKLIASPVPGVVVDA